MLQNVLIPRHSISIHLVRNEKASITNWELNVNIICMQMHNQIVYVYHDIYRTLKLSAIFGSFINCIKIFCNHFISDSSMQ